MAMFQYKPRSADSWEKTANMRGTDRQGFVKGQYRLYQVRKGDNAIRILPPTWDDPEDFGLHIWVHYGVGPENASCLCNRKMRSEECRICDLAQEAEDRGDEEEAQKWQPKRRVLIWLLDRKDERAGVMAWASPWTWARDVAKISKNRKTGEYYEVDNPERGYDIYFDREDIGQGFGGYSGYQIDNRPSSVPKESIDFIVENPLPDCLLWRDYDEVDTLLSGGVKSRRSDQEDRPSRSVESREDSLRRGREEEEIPPRRMGRPPIEEDEPELPLDKAPWEDEEGTSSRRRVSEKQEEKEEEPERVSSPSQRASRLRERFAPRQSEEAAE